MDTKTKEKLIRLIKQANDLVESDPDAERLYDLQKLKDLLQKAHKQCQYIIPASATPSPAPAAKRRRTDKTSA